MEVKALIQEPLFVPPETMPALKLLEHWRGYRFEVVDMDWPRVDKVLVAPGPGADPMP
jgi:CBS domain containing-hemolysin-like protein